MTEFIEQIKTALNLGRFFHSMEQQELLPHLFRAEFSKITAVICRHFGLSLIHISEPTRPY